MNTNQYLQEILSLQTLSNDSKEMEDLRAHREQVETVLCEYFQNSSPTIRYGGSKAKGTMIRELYDLDIICYFENEDTSAGETLEDIFNNTQKALSGKYLVSPQNSAIRLKSLNPSDYGKDFHIDVVPGRFTDDSKTDAFLYCSSGEKKRLKTNIQVHIDYIRDSGLADVIRLCKLWKIRSGLQVRNFALELMVIEILDDQENKDSLDECLLAFWQGLKDNIDNITIEDPANPTGNDLSELLNDNIRRILSSIASSTLQTIEQSGWEAVFGKVELMTDSKKIAAIDTVATTIRNPAQPWVK
jgi:hypothetical protein